MFKTEKDLNRFFLNGKIISVQPEGEYTLLNIQIFSEPEQLIPVHISSRLGTSLIHFPQYVQLEGALESIEKAPAVFEYRLKADTILESSMLKCRWTETKNVLECTAFLVEEPWENTQKHPYSTYLSLRTSLILDGSSFEGKRVNFKLTLLRKKCKRARHLHTGDIIKFKATIKNNKYGMHFICKNLNLINTTRRVIPS